MRERLEYAVIGLVLGLILAAVVWFLNSGVGFHRRSVVQHAELLTWLKYGGAGGAVAGFVLKERVGDLLGGVLHSEYDRATRPVLPWWMGLLILAVVVGMAWRFGR
jgi:hypothetical protein